MGDVSTGEPELRTSGLGLMALACALLSVASCVVVTGLSVTGVPAALVGVLALPLLGLMGVVLGGISLARKRASDGAVYTRGPAVAGVIVGLASAVLQGSVLVGAMRTFAPIKRQIVPVMNAMVEEVRAGRIERATQAIGEGARGVVAGRLAGFVDVCEGVCGGDMRASFSLGAMVRATAELREAMASAGPTAFQSGAPPKPVELSGSAGRLSAWVMLDEAALDRDQVKIVDVMVILPDGRVAALLPDGRFAQLARGVGRELVDLEGVGAREAASGASATDESALMDRAMARARATWEEFAVALSEAEPGRGGYAVKKGFAYGGDGGEEGIEYVWIAVESFDGAVFEGVVTTGAAHVEGVSAGDRVEVRPEEIADWMYLEGKALRGGFTMRVLYADPEGDIRRAMDAQGIEVPPVDF